MSLDKLLIIFIIIILPIAFVLNTYVGMQADTLSVQSLYDAKLLSATNDALKAYQNNEFNESASDLTVLQSQNVEACGNVFLNAIANNFEMEGFSKETLESHVPAVVFTMYDGFYIFSKFQNKIPDSLIQEYEEKYDVTINNEELTYPNGDYIYGVKPYISYSCRYSVDSNNDFVITYSLDNYISIKGNIMGEWFYDSGYLIDGVSNINDEAKTLTYRNITIKGENFFQEYFGSKLYKCVKVNGIKYYKDEEKDKWFSVLNDKINYTENDYGTKDYSAYNYYKEAYEFTNKIRNLDVLNKLKWKDAIEATGIESSSIEADISKGYVTYDESKNFVTNSKETYIFKKNDSIPIEEPNSNFNLHRLAVIRYTIEKNLSIAISNYNKYSGGLTTNFLMPVLDENDWDKILNNISVISFMQGIVVGNKTYNGYAVVSNNRNNEVVAEDSIYIVKMRNRDSINKLNTDVVATGGQPYYYYDIKKKNLRNDVSDFPVGIFIGDLQKRQYYDKSAGERYILLS